MHNRWKSESFAYDENGLCLKIGCEDDLFGHQIYRVTSFKKGIEDITFPAE